MSDTQKKESKTASSANDSQSSNANQWKPPKKPNNPAHKAMIEAKRKEAHARRRLYLARKKEAYATASIVDNLLSSVVGTLFVFATHLKASFFFSCEAISVV